MEKIDIKHFKFLLVAAIVSSMLSMYYGYQFGGEDALNGYVKLSSEKYNRTVYVSRDTSTYLTWVNDTLYFLPK